MRRCTVRRTSGFASFATAQPTRSRESPHSESRPCGCRRGRPFAAARASSRYLACSGPRPARRSEAPPEVDNRPRGRDAHRLDRLFAIPWSIQACCTVATCVARPSPPRSGERCREDDERVARQLETHTRRRHDRAATRAVANKMRAALCGAHMWFPPSDHRGTSMNQPAYGAPVAPGYSCTLPSRERSEAFL